MKLNEILGTSVSKGEWKRFPTEGDCHSSNLTREPKWSDYPSLFRTRAQKHTLFSHITFPKVQLDVIGNRLFNVLKKFAEESKGWAP